MLFSHPAVLILAIAAAPAAFAAPAPGKTIEFPCSRSLGDGHVLVDGPQWDDRMRELGYQLADGEYVPWEVLGFTETSRSGDGGWAEGTCRLKLLPVER